MKKSSMLLSISIVSSAILASGQSPVAPARLLPMHVYSQTGHFSIAFPYLAVSMHEQGSGYYQVGYRSELESFTFIVSSAEFDSPQEKSNPEQLADSLITKAIHPTFVTSGNNELDGYQADTALAEGPIRVALWNLQLTPRRTYTLYVRGPAGPQFLSRAKQFVDSFRFDHCQIQVCTAEQHSLELQRIEPGNPDARSFHAQALVEKGDLNGAIDEFREVVQREPDSADAHSDLARALYQKALLRKGDETSLDAALTECRRTVELEPGNGGFHDNLGLVLYQRRSFGEAVVEFLRAVDLDQNDATAHCGLAFSLKANGSQAGAATEFAKAHSLNHSDPEHDSGCDESKPYGLQ